MARQEADEAKDAALKEKARAEGARYAQLVAFAAVHLGEWNLGRASELLHECRWDERGWEHRYLDAKARQLFSVVQDGEAGPSPVELSPDGERLALGGREPRLLVAGTGRLLAELEVAAPVTVLAFSADGTLLATASGDRIDLRDADTGKPRLALVGNAGTVRQLAFSADGKRLLAAGTAKGIRVWDAATGKQGKTIPTAEGVRRFALRPDGKRLAVIPALPGDKPSERIELIDTETGKIAKAWKAHPVAAVDVRFSADGRTLASCGFQGDVMSWHEDGGLKAELARLGKLAHRLAFLDEGSSLAVACGQPVSGKPGEVAVIDVPGLRVVRTLAGPPGALLGLSAGTGRVATLSEDGMACVWNIHAGDDDGFALQGKAREAVFLPDGKTLACLVGEGSVQFWDADKRNEPEPRLKLDLQGAAALAVHPDGKTVAVAQADKARLYRVADGKPASDWLEGAGRIVALAFSPDGARLASCNSLSSTVRVWDAASGKRLLDVPGKEGDAAAVAWSPDGKTLAVGGNRVRLFNADGQERGAFKPDWYVRSLAFSPDGKRLAVCGSGDQAESGHLSLWDVPACRLAHRLRGHKGEVVRVAFSPDGKRLASASTDETVRLWSVATGVEVLSLPTGEEEAPLLAFDPRGRWLAINHQAELTLLDGGGQSRIVHTTASPAFRVVPSPDGKLLALHHGSLSSIHETASGERLPMDGAVLQAVAFLPDGKRLVGASNGDDELVVHDLATGKEVRRIKGGAASLAVANGLVLAGTEKVAVSDLDSGERRGGWDPGLGTVSSLAVSPDGKRVAILGEKPGVAVHDIATGKLVGRLDEAAASAAWLSDGRLAVAAEKALLAWEPGKKPVVLAERGGLSALASAEGWIAGGDGEGVIRLWDAATGKARGRLKGHVGPVLSLAFLPDGRLASGGMDRTMRLWRLPLQ
ncbi:MAG: hypothetical protein K2W96_04235 [Gemmataceae bacterium]|nr:hypothetical protein [Gemmataceae bacterium]